MLFTQCFFLSFERYCRYKRYFGHPIFQNPAIRSHSKIVLAKMFTALSGLTTEAHEDLRSYFVDPRLNASQKHESNLLHTYVL